MIRGAELSDCGLFRHVLWRFWDTTLPCLVFVMLNPSTADAAENDHTVVKCIEFARRFGFGGITIVNLWDFRATAPADLRALNYPMSLECDRWIAASAMGQTVCCAWGANARKQPARVTEVLGILKRYAKRIVALRLSADGTPWHPLMLPYSCELVPMPC